MSLVPGLSRFVRRAGGVLPARSGAVGPPDSVVVRAVVFERAPDSAKAALAQADAAMYAARRDGKNRYVAAVTAVRTP